MLARLPSHSADPDNRSRLQQQLAGVYTSPCPEATRKAIIGLPKGFTSDPSYTAFRRDNAVYLIRDPLHSGGIKCVYRALYFSIKETEAVQQSDCVLAEVAQEGDRDIVANGYSTISKLPEHPHVAAFLVAQTNPALVVIQDYYPCFLDNVTLPLDLMLKALAMVAQGLGHLHLHGVVHRDVKPPNIAITWDGVPKLTDFDFASLLGNGGSGHIPFYGTPAFSAPEALQKTRLGVEADVWSLAVTLYSLLMPLAGSGDERFCKYWTKEKERQDPEQPLPYFIHNAYIASLSPEGFCGSSMGRQLAEKERKIAFPTVWPSGTEGLKELIKSGLEVDPSKRPPANQMSGRLFEIATKTRGDDV